MGGNQSEAGGGRRTEDEDFGKALGLVDGRVGRHAMGEALAIVRRGKL